MSRTCDGGGCRETGSRLAPGFNGSVRRRRAFGEGASDAGASGGYKIRPYGPAFGFLVGAACMAARNQFPIRTGVRWFRSP